MGEIIVDPQPPNHAMSRLSDETGGAEGTTGYVVRVNGASRFHRFNRLLPRTQSSGCPGVPRECQRSSRASDHAVKTCARGGLESVRVARRCATIPIRWRGTRGYRGLAKRSQPLTPIQIVSRQRDPKTMEIESPNHGLRADLTVLARCEIRYWSRHRNAIVLVLGAGCDR